MKARARIAMLLVSMSICILTCDEHGARTVDERPNKLPFAKYYRPYEPDIQPDAPGYKLPLDVNNIVNTSKISQVMDFGSVSSLIRQNGFAIVELEPFSPLGSLRNGDLVSIYEPLAWHGLLPFVTSDTLLYLYHIQFDEILKDIEERQFVPDINSLTGALLDDALRQYGQLHGDLKEAAKRNVAYLSVARRLLDPKAPIPKFVDGLVLSELAKIDAHSGFKPSDIFIYQADYSQYVPRGHYTRSEALKRYFRTMMWYGSMTFLLKGSENWGPTEETLVSVRDARIQTLQAFLLVTSLKNVQVGERTALDVWDRLYTVTSFYVGLADDLTPSDYLFALDKVFEEDLASSDLTDQNKLFELRKDLAMQPSPRIYGGTGNIQLTGPITTESLNETLDRTRGMRLLGARFVPDSYIFQNLVFPQVGSYRGGRRERPFTAGSDGSGGLCRAYVRGLDLMALLGSNEALKILTEEGDTNYRRYGLRLGEMKGHFEALSATHWNVNLYWSWLYSLQALLQELPDGYPEFMRTKAWHRRCLHAALASWTELRHDTILHVKQSYPVPTATRLPTPPPGYVEPIPVFWGRLLSLTRMTSQGLGELNVLTPVARQQLERLEELLQQILDIATKQLRNESLSPDDGKFFKELPSMLDSVTPKTRDQGLSVALVADVHTHTVEAQVVEEAVGKVDLIIVACPMLDGRAFLAVGPVFSYYEFKQPMNNRLTDETWRKLLDSPQKPDRPNWYVPLMGASSPDF
ncbi:MAG: DUF3160 domain-containing protein [Planctomycetota bacterium]|jgi:hypothetical protein